MYLIAFFYSIVSMFKELNMKKHDIYVWLSGKFSIVNTSKLINEHAPGSLQYKS